MTTVIAALIAAAAALSVAVIERLLVHRGEVHEARTAVRRDAYARLIGSAMRVRGQVVNGVRPTQMQEAVSDFVHSVGLVQLVAPTQVVDKADAYVDALMAWVQNDTDEDLMEAARHARHDLIRSARADIGSIEN